MSCMQCDSVLSMQHPAPSDAASAGGSQLTVLRESVWRSPFLYVVAVLVLGCLLLMSRPALAMDFYRASAPVADQTAKERSRAAAQGLREVLVRISGSRDVVHASGVGQALSRASSYMDQFQYSRKRDEWGGAQEYLEMTFAPSVIEKLLRQAGVPFWPVNRPAALVWVVVDDPESGKQLVNDREDPVIQAVVQAAESRGVPLTFPLLDLDDQLALSAEDVWAMDEDAVLNASERYDADTVLVGRYTQTSTGQWWSTWQFFHRGQGQMYDARVDTAEEVGRVAIDPLADHLAGLYAVVSGGEGRSEVLMQVDGVSDFAGYRGVLSYLNGLAVLGGAELLMVNDELLTVRAGLDGTLEQFRNVLSLDGKLQTSVDQVSSSAPWISVAEGTPANPLRLRWAAGH